MASTQFNYNPGTGEWGGSASGMGLGELIDGIIKSNGQIAAANIGANAGIQTNWLDNYVRDKNNLLDYYGSQNQLGLQDTISQRQDALARYQADLQRQAVERNLFGQQYVADQQKQAQVESARLSAAPNLLGQENRQKRFDTVWGTMSPMLGGLLGGGYETVEPGLATQFNAQVAPAAAPPPASVAPAANQPAAAPAVPRMSQADVLARRRAGINASLIGSRPGQNRGVRPDPTFGMAGNPRTPTATPVQTPFDLQDWAARLPKDPETGFPVAEFQGTEFDARRPATTTVPRTGTAFGARGAMAPRTGIASPARPGMPAPRANPIDPNIRPAVDPTFGGSRLGATPAPQAAAPAQGVAFQAPRQPGSPPPLPSNLGIDAGMERRILNNAESTINQQYAGQNRDLTNRYAAGGFSASGRGFGADQGLASYRRANALSQAQYQVPLQVAQFNAPLKAQLAGLQQQRYNGVQDRNIQRSGQGLNFLSGLLSG